jgi:hypothetical protein
MWCGTYMDDDMASAWHLHGCWHGICLAPTWMLTWQLRGWWRGTYSNDDVAPTQTMTWLPRGRWRGSWHGIDDVTTCQFKMGLNWANYFSGTLFQFIQHYNKNSAQQTFPIFSPLTIIHYNQWYKKFQQITARKIQFPGQITCTLSSSIATYSQWHIHHQYNTRHNI